MIAHLDHNATTAASPEVVEAMLPWLTRPGANPSSLHRAGEEAADALRRARGEVAGLVGARSPGDIVFTSGGTESTNTALRSAILGAPTKRRVVTSTAEHSATRRALAGLAEEHDLELVLIGVDAEGHLDRNALWSAVDPDTAVVSLLVANNETGVISDLAGVGAVCRQVGALLHVDAVQCPGKHPIDVAALDCDYLSLSAHKLHGPRGIGALYVRSGSPFRPLILGGPQEGERRAGTENLAGAVGFGVAARIAARRAVDAAAIGALRTRRDRLESALLEGIDGARVHGGGAPRVPNTTAIHLPLGSVGLDASALLALLSSAGVEASAGSACDASRVEPSPVLLAMGVPEAEAASSIRLSLGHGTTDAEVEHAAQAILDAVTTLRGLGT